jgi:hypothetical protein
MKLIKLFITLLAFSFLSLNSLAETELLSDTDKISIKTVVSSQLQAFTEDDAIEAFSYASPKIQSIFRNADNFIAMVKKLSKCLSTKKYQYWNSGNIQRYSNLISLFSGTRWQVCYC